VLPTNRPATLSMGALLESHYQKAVVNPIGPL
jgi:hypothetical protein